MRLLPVILCLSFVTSCGAAYKSPSVTASPQVQVIPMTVQTIAAANQSPYQPRALPAAFQTTAGTGSGLRGPAVLPDPIQTPPNGPQVFQPRIPPPTTPGPYMIGVGDVLLLATPNAGSTVEELSGLLAAQNSRQGYAVQDDGAINIPNVGRVSMAGMSVNDAEAALFQRMVENQLDPTFSLEVAEFNARKVSIGGAVISPAIVPVTLTPLYLNEALARAGGVSLADRDDGALRLYRDGVLYQIPLAQYRNSADLQRLRLLDGDSIYVDAASDLTLAQAYFEQQISLAQTRQQARDTALRELQTEVALRRDELTEARENFETRNAMGAVPRDYVYLFGEVGMQSRYALPFEQRATLADALFDAGSGVPLDTGDVSQIYVLRGADGGVVNAWQLDGRNAANFTLAPRFELRPDDIIFVGEQPITRWGRVVQQLTPALITSGVAAATN